MAGYAIVTALLASLALTVHGQRRRSWPLLLLATFLALSFCVPEAPAIGFVILALPMLQFALALWHLVQAPVPVRALLCVAASTLFISQVPQALARMLS